MDAKYIVIGFILPVGMFIFFLIARSYWTLKYTPVSKIKELKPGLVKVHGRISAEKEVQTPLSLNPCVYFRCLKQEYIGNRSQKWRTLETTIDSGKCILKDETGSVPILLDDAELGISTKRKFKQETHTPSLMKLVARIITDEAVDVKTELKDITEEKTASLRRGDICYTEEFIQNKQEVTVIGTAKYNEDYTGLVVTKEGNEPYLIFDNERVILAPLRLGIILVGGMNAVFIAALFF